MLPLCNAGAADSCANGREWPGRPASGCGRWVTPAVLASDRRNGTALTRSLPGTVQPLLILTDKMSVKSLVIAGTAVGCVGVAAAGGYFAGQMNSSAAAVQAAEVAGPDAVQPPVSAPTEAPTPGTAAVVESAPEAAERPSALAPPSTTRQPERRPVPAPIEAAREQPAPAPTTESKVKKVKAERDPVAEPLPAPVAPQSLPAAETPLPLLPLPPGPPITPIETEIEEEPEPTKIGLTVQADSVIGVRLETPVSTATAKVEDRVVALVSREVLVDGQVAIPAGSRIEGYVTAVERGGKFRERARIGLTFNTLVLSPTERLPIHTETIFRDGDPPAPEATSKIGASAVVGSILGAVIGGKKGAAIGGAAGAAGGTAAVAAGGRNEAVVAEGTPLTLRLLESVTIVVESGR